MGGRRKPRTQRKHFKNSRENVWKRTDSELDNQNPAVPTTDSHNSNPTWSPFITENPEFEEYYKEQVIVPAEEWNTLMDCLKEPLPAAFRINSSSQFYTDIREQLENDFAKSIQAESIDGIELPAIKPLTWYPNNLAWHSNYSRKQLRKYPTLKRFHEFLKLENEIGNITRQEAVSMVPPLFLDVQPDHYILDMCAAPGSKTFQLLEMIHLFTESGKLPNGMIIANDVDVQRCHLLIHQTKRMSTANLIVTTNEAQHFPGCLKQLEFDRVLCDVPCSGDGTLRKAPDIWRKWNAGMGNGLHGLQVQIAMRGLALLKVGGKMVYSTCSMNPVENEAVVAEILRKCGESVSLVDVSSELPDLVRRPGLKKWKVRDKGIWLSSYRDVIKSRKAAVVPGMFPSGKSYNDATSEQLIDNNNNNNNNNNGVHNSENGSHLTEEEDVSDLPLERCMRIVPHDQNTGAFFIAVLQKHSPLPVIEKKTFRHREKVGPDNNGHSEKEVIKEELEVEDSTKTPTLDSSLQKLSIETEQTEPCTYEKSVPETIKPQKRLQIQGRWIGVDPVIFYEDNSVISKIKDFYGIKPSFPFNTHLITRNNDEGSVKRIYYVAKSVKEVLQLNLLAGEQLKIASVGIKMFERQSAMEGQLSACAFRISSEGLPLILPHMTKQILYASPVDFLNLLRQKRIKFDNFDDVEFGKKASNLMLGCCVVVLNTGTLNEATKVDASSIAIGCWRGRTNVSVMVTVLDCQEILERISKRLGIELEEKNSTINGRKDEIELKEEIQV